MSDPVNPAELDGQHVELLPARTVLSLFSAGNDGGTAGDGTDGIGKLGLRVAGFDLIPGGGNGYGTDGQNADGG